MLFVVLVAYAAVAGIAVVLVTAVAARSGRVVAGVMAAAPVTPTFAVLLLAPSAPEGVLLQGMSVVAATAIAILATGRLHRRLRHVPLVALALVPFGAWVFSFLDNVWVLVALTLVASLLSGGMPEGGGSLRRRKMRPLPVVVRFAVGAGSVAAVAAIQEWSPAWTPFVAVLPVLFVTSVLAVQVHVGEEGAVQVMRGGATGVVGVTGFVLAFTFGQWWGWTDGGSLVVAWCVYGLVAGAWSSGGLVVRSWGRRAVTRSRRPTRPGRIRRPAGPKGHRR